MLIASGLRKASKRIRLSSPPRAGQSVSGGDHRLVRRELLRPGPSEFRIENRLSTSNFPNFESHFRPVAGTTTIRIHVAVNRILPIVFRLPVV